MTAMKFSLLVYTSKISYIILGDLFSFFYNIEFHEIVLQSK